MSPVGRRLLSIREFRAGDTVSRGGEIFLGKTDNSDQLLAPGKSAAHGRQMCRTDEAPGQTRTSISRLQVLMEQRAHLLYCPS